MFEQLIAMQQQALDLRRRQIDFASQWLGAGQDMVSAQRQTLAAGQAAEKAWCSWAALWGWRG